MVRRASLRYDNVGFIEASQPPATATRQEEEPDPVTEATL